MKRVFTLLIATGFLVAADAQPGAQTEECGKKLFVSTLSMTARFNR